MSKFKADEKYIIVNKNISGRTGKEYYQENVDEIKLNKQQYRHVYADKIKSYNKQYFQENVEEIKNQRQQYRQEVPDKIKERDKAYKHNNNY